MSTDLATIRSTATAVSAARVMAQRGISSIVAVDDSKVAGILTETDFLQQIASDEQSLDRQQVADIMTSPVASIPASMCVFEACQIMEQKQVKRLPVMENDEIVGIVTQTDLVRVLTSHGTWRDVAAIMTRDVVGVQTDATVAGAARIMTAHNISCVVAQEGEKVVGLLTKRDFLKRVVASRREPTRTTIEEVMSSPAITVPSHYSVFSTSKIMSEANIRRLVVMDGDRLCGIVAQTDIFRAVRDKLRDEEDENIRSWEESESSIYCVDRKGKTTYVNPAFVRLFELSAARDVLGKPFLPERFWHSHRGRDRLLREIDRGSTRIKDLALKTAKGKSIYITLFSTLTKNVHGETSGSQGVIHDVTEKRELATLRRAEEALRESERRYRLLAEHVKDVIWTADLNMRWTYVSPSVEILRGFDVTEAMQQTLAESLTETSAEITREALTRELALARKYGDAATRELTLEIEFIRKDGFTVWTDVKISFLHGEDGEPLGFLGVVRDATVRRQVELELKQYTVALESANKVLEEFFLAAQAASKAKTEFLANMSHEIRTPMTAIIGFANELAERISEAADVEAVETIKRNGNYLLEIINDILDLSKIEAGKMSTERVACSPYEIVEDVVSLAKVRSDPKGLSLELDCKWPIPATIITDPIRLRQILINLVGNAVKFTESGTVRVAIQLLPGNEDHEPRLQFQVVDTGIGMTDEQTERIFEPFTQSDASTSRKFGGTGLGLAINNRLIEMLGGTIDVTSLHGEGSTFTATLPTGSLDGVPMLLEADTTDRQTSNDRPVSRSSVPLNCRILLAEDGRDNQRLISLILKKAGADVAVAENGRIALEKALRGDRDNDPPSNRQAGPFQLILMDMQMPVMDGYEATRRLRSKGYSGSIVALTAHAMKGDRQKCLDAGCDDYMTKPIDKDKLLALVAKYVRRAQGNGLESAGRR